VNRAFELIGGREPRPLVIVAYSDDWPRRFREHEVRIRGALGNRALLVEHVGSTSVPGLAAKPIVDVCVAVPDIEDESLFRDALEREGYELRVREQGHRMFRTPTRDAHVHVYAEGDAEIEAYLVFRDHLRRDAADRARYEALKRELAQRDWGDMQDYADAKGPLVREILDRARR
jgi:GrpB-like predicted nucleotidyltransferase (UPF0157 family)